MSEVSSRLTLTSFVPRQVMLETATNRASAASKNDDYEKKKNKKRKDEILTVMEVEGEGKKSKKKNSAKDSSAVENGFSSVETLVFDRASGDAISQKGKGREDLLRSIAEFLEGSGFVKTLSVFRSEAQIEVNNKGGSCINLEDLFDKFIELSKREPVASIEWSKEQDVGNKDRKRKIKQVSDLFGQENDEKNFLDATLGTKENTDYGKPLNVEKKKKHKVILGENMGEVVSLNVEEVAKEKIEELKDLTSNPNVEAGDFEKDKCEKKKKKKEAKQFEWSVNQNGIAKKPDDGESTKHPELVNSDNFVNHLPEIVDGRKKDKKKNKNKKLEKSTSDTLHTSNSDKIVEETFDGVGKHDNEGLQKFDIRKNNNAISEENTTDVETTTNKKRKRSSSKETAISVENLTAASKTKKIKPKVAIEEKEERDHKILTCSEPSPLSQESKEPCKTLSRIVLDEHVENPTSQDPQKQFSGHQLANEPIEKHQKEGSTRPKSMKKEKQSGEPKAVTAFQRVNVDEVQFADERLQDNSYWAMDDSGSGYGAKAQEVLGQVKGRGFRHEKTKKKRGTYRGGQIDLQSHSIKFNYSDDE